MLHHSINSSKVACQLPKLAKSVTVQLCNGIGNLATLDLVPTREKTQKK